MPMNKTISYDNATQKLTRQVMEMRVPDGFSSEYDMGDVLLRFRAAFRIPKLRHAVLNPMYESKRFESANFAAGFCGIASYSWSHIFRMPNGKRIWHMYQSNDPCPHVWLKNISTGQILDLTFDQFDFQYPYENGILMYDNVRFDRAIKFGKYIGIDIEEIIFINALKNMGARGR